MTDSISHQINRAALQMANDLNENHERCKQVILLFVGAEDEAQFYNLVMSDEGTAKTKGIRHIVHNGKNVTVLDLLDGVTTLAGLAFLQKNIDSLLSAIAGGLFLIRAVQNATSVELSNQDASVAWALYTLGGSAEQQALLDAWRDIVEASDIVDASVTTSKLKARLANLIELGCIKLQGTMVTFAEPVEVKA